MKRGSGLLVTIVIALIVAGAPAAISAPGPTPGSAAARTISAADFCADDEELTFLALINDYRAEQGLAGLVFSRTLGAAAEHHSWDMAASDEVSHTLSDGTDWADNIANHGYGGASVTGENVAAGNASAEGTFEQWRNSEEHNANMLTAEFNAIGIGRAANPDGSYGWYWTTVFGDVVDGEVTTCSGLAEGDTSGDDGSEPPLGSEAVTTADLNLRTEPSLAADVLLVIPAGGSVSVAGDPSDGFAPVTYAETNGWASIDYLEGAIGDADGDDSAGAPEDNAGAAMVTADLNLRVAPDTEADVIDVIPAGSSVTLTGDSENGFLSVDYGGADGWAFADYIDIGGAGPDSAQDQGSDDPSTANGETATVLDDLNLRAGPSLDDDVVLIIPAGTTVVLAGESVDGFVPVAYDGVEGWVSSSYLG